MLTSRPVRMTQKKARFIAEFLKCGDAQAAAVAAGYSGAGGSARTLGWRLLHKDPLVKKAVADARAELRERAMVTTEGMLKQLSEDREFAISKGNPMAAVKATENIEKAKADLKFQEMARAIAAGGGADGQVGGARC